MYADEYHRRIDTYDQAIRDAQLKAQDVPEHIAPPAGLPLAECAAHWRLSPEHVAVERAYLNREQALLAWEREMDVEDELAKYGITPASRMPLPINVIAVDFANRARVSGARRTRGGR